MRMIYEDINQLIDFYLLIFERIAYLICSIIELFLKRAYLIRTLDECLGNPFDQKICFFLKKVNWLKETRPNFKSRTFDVVIHEKLYLLPFLFHFFGIASKLIEVKVIFWEQSLNPINDELIFKFFTLLFYSISKKRFIVLNVLA